MTHREPHDIEEIPFDGIPARPARTDDLLPLDGPGVPAPLALAAQILAASDRRDYKATTLLRRELLKLGWRFDKVASGPTPGEGGRP